MTNSLSWIKTGNKLTVVLPNGQPKTITEDNKVFAEVLQAIKDNNWDLIPSLLDPKVVIYNFSDGNFEVKDGAVFVNNKVVPDALSKKIIAFSKEGLPYKPLLNFWEKLQKNTSYKAVNGLFEFLDRHEYPITEDGDIIAYKGVKADWTDCYSGKMSNKVGETVSMPRNEVDESEEACKSGLHVASFSFATNGYGNGVGGHTIMVSINPEDVVSMPSAYEFTKFRVCKYVVLAEVEVEKKEHLYQELKVENECYGECDTCECDELKCDCSEYNCEEYGSHHNNCKCGDNGVNFGECYVL